MEPFSLRYPYRVRVARRENCLKAYLWLMNQSDTQYTSFSMSEWGFVYKDTATLFKLAWG